MNVLPFASVLLALSVTTTTFVENSIEPVPAEQDFYACVWYPLCDQEIRSPLTEPKDSKSKTDSKDNKNDKDAKLA